ncbi:alpha-glucosidase [Kwoniella heveanensis CBS 569]|nr:alpha-glucosidase [Kwoniella heveanensis CBS 569]
MTSQANDLKPTAAADKAWWKSATVYQVYPASFCDHGANGHGTLLGILSKVDYLQSLGVDILWLSPIYESPQADMGYDIADYRQIDPRYGSLDDWDRLLAALHERGMKLVMDLVVNHTSDQHAWFKESRSSRDNPKRDWYIWRPARYNEKNERIPPNNWKATFGQGSAWEYDEATDEYYLHLFLKEQPDLNWENPKVRAEIYDMMHWWLKRGADGFRMDVINFIAKAPGLPDAPVVNPDRVYQPFGTMSINRPEVHRWLKEMNREVLSKYDCFAVGECPGDETVAAYAPYSVRANMELQMVFHFHHQSFDRANGGFARAHKPDWKLSELKRIFNTWQVEMAEAGGWNSNYLENHDQPRIVSRMASDHPLDRERCAKLLALFHCSLSGTIYVYQGQELGMINVPRDWDIAEYKDVETIHNFEAEVEHRRVLSGQANPDISDLLEHNRMTARDNGRTPMQWDSTLNAGFSKGEPWMRIHDNYREGWNAAQQMKDPKSTWSFWQRTLRLRKENDAMIYGRFIPLDESNEETYAYIREDLEHGQKLLVVLNLARGGDQRGVTSTVVIPSEIDTTRSKLLISNVEESVDGRIYGEISLAPWEGRIYSL